MTILTNLRAENFWISTSHEFYLINTGKWKIPIYFYEFISKIALIRGSEGKNSINFLKFKLQSNCCFSFFLKLPQFPIKSNHGRQGPEKSYSFFFFWKFFTNNRSELCFFDWFFDFWNERKNRSSNPRACWLNCYRGRFLNFVSVGSNPPPKSLFWLFHHLFW